MNRFVVLVGSFSYIMFLCSFTIFTTSLIYMPLDLTIAIPMECMTIYNDLTQYLYCPIYELVVNNWAWVTVIFQST